MGKMVEVREALEREASRVGTWTVDPYDCAEDSEERKRQGWRRIARAFVGAFGWVVRAARKIAGV